MLLSVNSCSTILEFQPREKCIVKENISLKECAIWDPVNGEYLSEFVEKEVQPGDINIGFPAFNSWLGDRDKSFNNCAENKKCRGLIDE